ncbi:HNH endonuclease [Halomonas salifodinae]|uniref:HNH endonuclease n=1 Tax=Halomonas salifodinae TaxID=438745 RepID=UPI0033A49354
MHTYLTTALESGNYERHPERLKGRVKEESQTYARSAAFRSLILEAYDYRCAASRLRYITPDYRYLVEAAHLIPFAESQDDRPTNGIALTPNLHWAMDNQLIAPGPDHRWHVSPGIDTLNSDNRWLCELDGQPLVLPRDPRWAPDREALDWRLKRLLR